MATQTISERPIQSKIGYLISLSHSESEPVTIGEFITLGRDTNNMIEISDPYISSRHARIERKDSGYLLKDLRSKNGTFVNGARINEVYLCPGDVIKIGERELLFHNEEPQVIDFSNLKSKNGKWDLQLKSIPLFAKTGLPVLLLGQSGSGKEVIARLIHEYSTKSTEPFISVNCSALTESLVESELFGHVKGSYTGATHDRKGAFEAARGGTLFLDEIGDLPMSLQPKLLRALENKEIRPVGSDQIVATDVRIIAATHQNLHQRISEGLFRSDLFYRINVIRLTIPQLRERFEDFEKLLYGFAREMKVQFSFLAVEEMKKHSWPGNIRELKNAVARASALYSGVRIQPEHIANLIDVMTAESLAIPKTFKGKLPVIKELEREMIKQRLIANKGNQRQTAIDLNMPKSTLHDRIRTYGLTGENLELGFVE